MNIYERPLHIRSIDAAMDRKLRPSVLLSLIQESAIAHTEELGMGREKTLDRGLLWIVTMHSAVISRMPEYDEDVILRSWPGETMHLLFPRYFTLSSPDGTPLVKASAIWSLIDVETRRLIFPERYGIEIRGVTTGDEIALPVPVRPLPATEERIFTVPYSYVDLNGHMNNTRYADLAEDCIHEKTQGLSLESLRTEFTNEARLGDELALSVSRDGNRFLVSGSHQKPCFRIELCYQ